MKNFILIIFTFFLSHAYTQNVYKIYREDFYLFFNRENLESRYDVVSLVDSLPKGYKDGEYHFYDVEKKDSANCKLFLHTYGNYENRVKEGEFVSEKQNFNKKNKKYEIYWQQVITYLKGQKDGFHKEYYISYQYNLKKVLINEATTFTVYIEYTKNQYNGFYMVLTEFHPDPLASNGQLVMRYYENGTLIKTMKYEGLGKKEIYHFESFK